MIVSPATANLRAPAAVPGATGVVPLRKFAFPALGTTCEVQFAGADDAPAQAFQAAVVAWVGAFEAKYSRFRPSSLISRINQAAGAGWVTVDAEMEQMLDFCGALHGMTNGLLDATALPLLRLWDYRAARPVVPSRDQIAAAQALVGWSKVQRAPGRVALPRAGMALDFGGFGKEYAVDVVAQMAVERGLGNVLVDFGHDIRVLGAPPGRPLWHIGLEDPARPGERWGSVAVTNRGVASSGDYLRGFTVEGRRYGHIIDPRTGWPAAHGCTQTTIIADTCLQAGVLSTSAFILGPEEGLKLIQSTPGAEGVILTADRRAQTRGFFNHVVSD
jgi:thiamine biosynthesis lipoprotein